MNEYEQSSEETRLFSRSLAALTPGTGIVVAARICPGEIGNSSSADSPGSRPPIPSGETGNRYIPHQSQLGSQRLHAVPLGHAQAARYDSHTWGSNPFPREGSCLSRGRNCSLSSCCSLPCSMALSSRTNAIGQCWPRHPVEIRQHCAIASSVGWLTQQTGNPSSEPNDGLRDFSLSSSLT